MTCKRLQLQCQRSARIQRHTWDSCARKIDLSPDADKRASARKINSNQFLHRYWTLITIIMINILLTCLFFLNNKSLFTFILLKFLNIINKIISKSSNNWWVTISALIRMYGPLSHHSLSLKNMKCIADLIWKIRQKYKIHGVVG